MVEAERLFFRQWKETDKIIFGQMNSDPIVMEHFPKMLNRAESDSLADKISNRLNGKDYGLRENDYLDSISSYAK